MKTEIHTFGTSKATKSIECSPNKNLSNHTLYAKNNNKKDSPAILQSKLWKQDHN